MTFVLCISHTAHAEEKKKKGHTNPDVRTIIIRKIADVPSMWGFAALAQIIIPHELVMCCVVLLQRVLDTSIHLLSELERWTVGGGARGDCCCPVTEKAQKLEQLKSVMEM